jgi:uncharacterized protein YjeT (DUF2065 family)
MEHVVQQVCAPLFVLIGLSHLLQPVAWKRFFDRIRETGVGAYIVAMMQLPTAVFIVAGHNRWVADWPVAITIVGWGSLVKCALYLLLPQTFDRVVTRATKDARAYQVPGAVLLVLGAILTVRVLLKT